MDRSFDSIEPCPFCGSADIVMALNPETETRWMMCRNCKAEGPINVSPVWALRLWNKRYTPNTDFNLTTDKPLQVK